MIAPYIVVFFFFLNDAATTEIYTLSLHDAFPIFPPETVKEIATRLDVTEGDVVDMNRRIDRKSTRLNSSHPSISYAVFCLIKHEGGRCAGLGGVVRWGGRRRGAARPTR